MKRFVGLSLSFCVRAILRGDVPIEKVAFIVPGFRWTGAPHPSYYDVYWNKFPREEVDRVLNTVPIVTLPDGMDPPNVSQGMWWPEDEWDWSVIPNHTKRLTHDQVKAS